MTKPVVSIVIVSYNTRDLLVDCLSSIKRFADVSYEIIVSDNGSTDGTLEALRAAKGAYGSLKLLENNDNLGFAKGNNQARSIAKGEYILFLNPDTLLHKGTLSKTISYIKGHPDVGAVTCKVTLKDGSLDLDTRRSFPTPLIALTHFSGLDRLFKHSPVFAKYWYGYMSPDTTHEIDALQGAYMLASRKVLDSINWFDEDYFLDGEDIDLCWKIHESGFKIIYYPVVSITHIKKGSKSKNKTKRSVVGGVNAMEIFYRKRLWSHYPLFVNYIVVFGVRVLRLIRTLKYYL